MLLLNRAGSFPDTALATLIVALLIAGLAGASPALASQAARVMPASSPALTDEHFFDPPAGVWEQIAADRSLSRGLRSLALGVIDLAAGDSTKARERFEALRERDDGSPYPDYFLARMALESGHAAQAIDHLKNALIRQRGFAPAYQLLGRAHLVLGQTSDAFSAMRTVIALTPGHAALHLELGLAYLNHAAPDEAAIELQRACELDTSLHEARFLLARARLNSGEVELGVAALERYLNAARDLPEERERVERAKTLLSRYAAKTS